MLSKLAFTFGAVFVLVGILGFIPSLTPNDHLLGIFHLNAAHNAVHLLSGAVAILCGMTGAHAAKMFFRTFGIIYGLVAILGFAAGNQPIFGIIANNVADEWLHVVIAAGSLLLGFIVREDATSIRHEPHRA